MPKQKITKETVVNAAFELAKEKGLEQVTVKTLSEKLSCSVQPIYTYCSNMENLRRDVAEKAKIFVKEYISAKIDKTDPFRGTGQAFLRLAKEEPYIYKIFILHQRENIRSLEELYEKETEPRIAEAISERLNTDIDAAKRLHLNMLIYTIGIGAVLACTEIPPEEIFPLQEHAYRAFLNQALNGKGESNE